MKESRPTLPVYRSLGELAGSAGHRDDAEREFRVPIDSAVDRRELLALAGASLALAGVGAAGCTRQPAERIHPYVKPPEEVVPGEPLFYATAHLHGGYARGIVVESHEGRPTKVEGNALHPGSLGGTDVFMQAFLLGLYDPDRSQTLTERGAIRPWSAFLAAARLALERERPARGAGLRFLTGPTTSPTLVAQIDALRRDFPEARWVVWDPAASDAPALGAELAYGEPLETRYAFDRADVVLSLDADFLGSGPAQPRYARDFAARRRGESVSRLYAVESTPSVTGAKADHRRALAPDAVAAFARAVAAAVGAVPSGPSDAFASAVAGDLTARRGAGLVVAGDAQPAAVHALAHAINERLGNAGRTVVHTDRVAAGPADRLRALTELVADMRAGRVTTLAILGGNPVFDAPADLGFAEALAKVPVRLRLGLYDDETSRLCHWHVPEAHALEAWSDARAIDGTATILQPLILPLFSGKSAHEFLAAFSEQPEKSGYDLVRDRWRDRLPGEFEGAWRRALHDGVVAGTALPAKSPALRAGPPEVPRPPAGALTVLFRPDPTVWDGAYANNGWLQELPKPLTKLTWDNAALLAPATAGRLAVANGDVLEIESDGRKVAAPAWILPGQAEGCVTLSLGYGRVRGGRTANGKGFDAYVLRGTGGLWSRAATARRTGERRALSATDVHHSMEGRDIVRSVTAAEYARDPEAVRRMGERPPGPDETLYPKLPVEAAYAWGMAIDLSACVGCNACMVACQAENNIPIVGKHEVARGREMHWIRVDRYWSGSPEDPQSFFQPVPCMHCEDAPCETVCPVAATVHSAEGLNQMVYNRCVGTRYCSNNCPYKVRRFNFFLYSDFRTELTKLVRNPEVTVRSRGVMEKCTYCVQRINRARIAAERESRPIRDGEIVTACQQACPARAIVFGDIRDPESAVSRAKAEKRGYALLTELGTRPRTTYLADLRNPNPALPGNAPSNAEDAS